MGRVRVINLVLAVLLTLTLSQTVMAEHVGLSAAGPVLADTDAGAGWSAGYNGYPMWYRDKDGVVLELTNPPDPANVPDAVDPNNPFSVQIGFGSEAFYWLCTSDVALPTGGRALLGMGLEAAFATGPAADGDQMVFARVRIRIDTPSAGTYTVYHPYGVKTYVVAAAGTRSINDTIDIGAVPGDFNAALKGAIGPFLKQDPPPADTTLIGDGATVGPVIGSPEIFPATGQPQNFFRIEGPGIGGPGVPVFETTDFVVSGKYFAGTPFRAGAATYARDAAGNTTLFGFAKTFPPYAGETMSINAVGAPAPANLSRRRVSFFGSMAFGIAAPPASLSFTATGGLNPTTLDKPVKDIISISQADFSLSAGTVTVTAASSDLNTAAPVSLTVRGPTSFTSRPLTPGVPLVVPVTIPPVRVVVTSSGGGRGSALINIVP